MYSRYSNQVTEIIEDQSPLFEKASIDEHYIDITGMDKYVKNELLWTKELRQTIIKQTGLPISFGLSQNKTVSKIATGEGKPHGEKYIVYGTEKPFLAPLSIKKIPGIGGKTYPVLRSMGIERIETIQSMPVLMMQKVLGENGLSIWRKANGIDTNPIEPYTEQKSMSTETTYDKDTTDVAMLRKELIGMTNKLAFELRKQKKSKRLCDAQIKIFRFSDPHLSGQYSLHRFRPCIVTKNTRAVSEKLFKACIDPPDRYQVQ